MKRYEREIEEILKNIVDFPSDGKRRPPPRRRRPGLWARIRNALPTFSSGFTGNNLAIAAILLTLLGFALRDYAPRLAPYASTLAVGLFVVIIAQGFRRRRPRYEKRWRGRPIEFPKESSISWHEFTFRLAVLWRSLRWWTNRR